MILVWVIVVYTLKVYKIEIFFGFDFEICIISLLVIVAKAHDLMGLMIRSANDIYVYFFRNLRIGQYIK